MQQQSMQQQQQQQQQPMQQQQAMAQPVQQQQQEKILCGNGKEYGQYGSVGISICLEQIPIQYQKKHTNGKTYLNLKLNKRKNVGNYGETHYIEVDTFVPQSQQQQRPVQQPMQQQQAMAQPVQQQQPVQPQMQQPAPPVQQQAMQQQVMAQPMQQQQAMSDDEIPF